MLANYLKTAFRNLMRYRVYSLINILGLAIGMAACLLIFLFVRYELGFDRFHRHAGQIWRVNEVQSFGGITPQHVALSMFPMGPALQEEYPEVRGFTRFWDRGEQFFRQGEQGIFIKKVAAADTAFLTMFDFPLRAGDVTGALREPYSIVLTEETARKFFGDADPLGRQMLYQDSLLYRITGVLREVPANSHLQFDALVSISTFDTERRRTQWGSNFLVTYLQLAEDVDIAGLEAKFPAFLTKYIGEGATDYYQLYLQPFLDVHLGSTDVTHDYQNFQKFDRRYIYVFVILGIFILIIAGINFMNITAARAASRGKEVGVRKTVGAGRLQLTGQFVGESVLLALLASMLAIAIAEMALPYLNTLSERNLRPDVAENALILPAVFVAAALTGLLAGIYPALLISAFRPAMVLKGLQHGVAGKSRSRSILVVSQFTIAIIMIAGTILAMQQLNYMREQDLGFDSDHILLLPMSDVANDQYRTLQTEFLKHPGVLGVTASGQRLGNNVHQMSSRYEGKEDGYGVSILNVDLNYLDFYSIAVLEGRGFNPEREADRGSSYLMNQALARKLGWDQPVGKGAKLSWKEEMGTVIGLVKDFNFNSLHHQIEPLLITAQDWSFNEMSVKVRGNQLAAAIAHLDSVWGQLVGDRPFDFTFLDTHLAELYRADRQSGTVIGIIAVLALVIACLGLFGLASITTVQRTKEIGIRKVLGASPRELVLMLSRGFAGMVGVAFLIAAPLTYLLMQRWLENFAYRIEINSWVFVLAGALSLAIALLTISFHALRAARTNPVSALRSE